MRWCIHNCNTYGLFHSFERLLANSIFTSILLYMLCFSFLIYSTDNRGSIWCFFAAFAPLYNLLMFYYQSLSSGLNSFLPFSQFFFSTILLLLTGSLENPYSHRLIMRSWIFYGLFLCPLTRLLTTRNLLKVSQQSPILLSKSQEST